jgi:hypothetical protein
MREGVKNLGGRPRLEDVFDTRERVALAAHLEQLGTPRRVMAVALSYYLRSIFARDGDHQPLDVPAELELAALREIGEPDWRTLALGRHIDLARAVIRLLPSRRRCIAGSEQERFHDDLKVATDRLKRMMRRTRQMDERIAQQVAQGSMATQRWRVWT